MWCTGSTRGKSAVCRSSARPSRSPRTAALGCWCAAAKRICTCPSKWAPHAPPRARRATASACRRVSLQIRFCALDDFGVVALLKAVARVLEAARRELLLRHRGRLGIRLGCFLFFCFLFLLLLRRGGRGHCQRRQEDDCSHVGDLQAQEYP